MFVFRICGLTHRMYQHLGRIICPTIRSYESSAYAAHSTTLKDMSTLGKFFKPSPAVFILSTNLKPWYTDTSQVHTGISLFPSYSVSFHGYVWFLQFSHYPLEDATSHSLGATRIISVNDTSFSRCTNYVSIYVQKIRQFRSESIPCYWLDRQLLTSLR